MFAFLKFHIYQAVNTCYYYCYDVFIIIIFAQYTTEAGLISFDIIFNILG